MYVYNNAYLTFGCCWVFAAYTFQMMDLYCAINVSGRMSSFVSTMSSCGSNPATSDAMCIQNASCSASLGCTPPLSHPDVGCSSVMSSSTMSTLRSSVNGTILSFTWMRVQ